MKKNTSIIFALLVNISLLFSQQPDKPTSSEIFHNLQKLNFLGSAMYIAAHPDDENTRIISFLSNDIIIYLANCSRSGISGLSTAYSQSSSIDEGIEI